MPKTEKSIADLLSEFAAKIGDPSTAKNVYSYKPHPKQLQFHQANSNGRLYIGGNRAGKTVGGAVESIYRARGEHPFYRVPPAPTRGRVVAVDFLQGVEKIVRPEIAAWLPPSLLVNGSWEDSYSRELRTLTCSNGSTIEFMSYDQALNKFAGTSRHWTWFDEEAPKAIWQECLLRLADTGSSYAWWMTMTPVEGMTWVYDDLYIPGSEGRDPNLTVIELASDENPYLDPSVLDAIFANMSEDDRNARRLGKFVQLGGLIYPQFDEAKHVIDPITDHSLYANAKLYASMDHGYHNPTAWLWHYVLPNGNIITFDEHYEGERLIEYHAQKVKEIDKRHGRQPMVRVGDPSIAQRNGTTGTSIQTEYSGRGIPIMLGNNDVDAGVNVVASYLQANKWFITRNCANLIHEVKRYRWKVWASQKLGMANNAQERPHKKDDHAVDSIRYFFMLQPRLQFQDTSLIKGGPLPIESDFRVREAAPTVGGIHTPEWQTVEVDDFMGTEW